MKTKLLQLTLSLLLFSNFNLEAQWTSMEAHIPTDNHIVWGLEAVGDNLIWGLTFDIITFGKPEYSIKSTDGGTTWDAIPIDIPANQYSLHIFPLDENTAWLATSDEANPTSGRIFKTTDGGLSWTEQSSAFTGFNETPAGVYFWDENEGVAFGANGFANYDDQISVYRTNDGGDNWEKIVPPDFPAQLPHEGLWVYTDNGFFDVQGDNVWFVTNGPRIYRSTDRGATWTAHDTGLTNPAGIASIAFKDELNGIVVGYNSNAAAKTSDGGMTWQPLPIPSSPQAVDIIHVPGTSGTYVLHNAIIDWSAASSLTMVTYDDGQTWDTLSTEPNFNCMEFKSPSLGLAGGKISSSTSGIYKWTGDPLRRKIFVDDSAEGNNDGSSWADAYPNLQDALEVAENGDQIWVAEGTYVPGTDSAGSFLIEKNIRLYGGFAGWETSLSERDLTENETILSGDFAGDDIPGDFDTNREDNAINVVRIDEEAGEAIIDGFTIKGGTTLFGQPPSGADYSLYRGGGILMNSSGIIRNCNFWDNTGRWGSACFTNAGDDVIIENCNFHDNHATRSALNMTGHISSYVVNCQFTENIATEWGGAVNVGNSNCTFKDCQFSNNTAETSVGGAVFIWQNTFTEVEDPRVIVENCTFSNNYSPILGSGLTLNNFVVGSSLLVNNCLFENNGSGEADGNLYGGALSLNNNNNSFGGTPTLGISISNSKFISNAATYSGAVDIYSQVNQLSVMMDSCEFIGNSAGAEGGGLLLTLEGGTLNASLNDLSFSENSSGNNGGGLGISNYTQEELSFSLSNSHFENNSTQGAGGGMSVIAASGSITACTFGENSATDGGGLSASNADSLKIERSLFHNNSSLNHGAGLYHDGGETELLVTDVALWENEGLSSIYSNEGLFMRSVTMYGNQNGIMHESTSAMLRLQNNILADDGSNYLSSDLTNVETLGGNLSDDTSLASALTGANGYLDFNDTNPLLDAMLVPTQGSPCIDAGNPIGIDSTSVDAAGNPRIQGTGIDIGAFESPFATATREVIAGQILLSPNPTTDFIQLQLPESIGQANEISLFNAQGRLVQQLPYTPGQQVQTGHLPGGFYLLKLSDGEQVYIGKFVKQ